MMRLFCSLVVVIGSVGVSLASGQDREVRVGLRTMADIRKIATALEMYATDHGTYPIVGPATADTLRSVLSGEYLDAYDSTDEWERPLYVVSSGLSFAVWSHGRDGKEDAAPRGGPQQSVDSDIIFSQRLDEMGLFWQGPANADSVGSACWGASPIRTAEAELRALKRLGVPMAP